MKPITAAIAVALTSVNISLMADTKFSNGKIATADEIKEKAEEKGGLVYINNDTFLADPSSLIGSVLVIRKDMLRNGDWVLRPQFEVMGFSRDFHRKSAPANYIQNVRSLLVNQSLAVNVGFLTFFKSEITATNVLSMVIRNEMIERAVDDAKWRTAFSTWKQTSTGLFKDPDVVRILVVRAYTLKSVTYKNYKQAKGKLNGAYAVSLEGNLYSATEENSIAYLWGLDYGILYSAPNVKPVSDDPSISFAVDVHEPTDPSDREAKWIGNLLNGKKLERGNK